MNKSVLIFTCFMCILSFTFSSLQMSEINFRGDEFVEIILENNSIINSFNESYFIVDNNEEKNNTFSQIQSKNNSKMILIGGKNFIDANEDNISQLNCSVYETSNSQVGFGGLSKYGEAFTIYFDSNLSIKYNDEYEIPDDGGDSLHFNSSTQFIAPNSPCEFNEFQNFNSNSDSNSTNFNNTVSINNFNQSTNSTSSNESYNSTNNQENIKSNCELNLDVDDIIEDSKIQFTFTGNTSLGVTYFIEDGAGNVVRSPFTSSTASSKSYTPRKNGKFIVFGEINDENCGEEIKVNKSTFFYNSQLDKEENNDDSDSSSSSSNPRVERDTYINILQAVQISPNQIKLMVDVSRGDSRSYRMKINVNDEEVAQYDVGKYGNFDFEIPLTLEVGKNTIEVTGFGEEDKIDITIDEIESNMDEEMENRIRNIVKEEQEALLKNLPSNNLEISNDETFSILRSSLNQNNSNSIPTSRVMTFNETNSLNNQTNSTYFSKHFFYQNTGILFIILSLVLVAGVIILIR